MTLDMTSSLCMASENRLCVAVDDQLYVALDAVRALFLSCVLFLHLICYRYIEIFQSKRMDYYSAVVGQLQSQVCVCLRRLSLLLFVPTCMFHSELFFLPMRCFLASVGFAIDFG